MNETIMNEVMETAEVVVNEIPVEQVVETAEEVSKMRYFAGGYVTGAATVLVTVVAIKKLIVPAYKKWALKKTEELVDVKLSDEKEVDEYFDEDSSEKDYKNN